MTIVDDEIASLIRTAHPLITDFEPENLSNCRYNLRAARAFQPPSGEERVIGGKIQRWTIKAAETLIIMTQESIELPGDIYATYSQLNSLAQKGLMLINVSIVEPGYFGKLSCFLVNFSREPVHLYRGDEVAKICFHRLSHAPTKLHPMTIPDDKYQRDLRAAAASYPASFMDIVGFEKRVSKSVTSSVNKSIFWAGGLIALLLLWASLEPLTHKFLWENIGVLSSTEREEIDHLRLELEKTKTELATSAGDLKTQQLLTELQKQVAAQANEIANLKQGHPRR